MSLLDRRRGEAVFEGKKKKIACNFTKDDLEKQVLIVGDLVELECETPLEPKVNIFELVKSKKPPLVIASGDGKLVLVISADKVEKNVKVSSEDENLKSAINLYEAFHGTASDAVHKVSIDEPEYLIFFGHLNFIVYDVPKDSERRGVPFIHEAKDKGDGVAPAKDKPVICVSPSRDYLIISGSEFEFTERGIIG